MILILLLILNFSLISLPEAKANLSCANLRKQTANLFSQNKNAKPDTQNVWKDAGKVFNKAMDLAFANQKCYTKAEISGMKKALKDLKAECLKAKADPDIWWLLRGMCDAYSPSFKYGK